MHRMGEEINTFTVSSVLSACNNHDTFKEALQIQCWILKIGLYIDPVVKASLIHTYSKAGAVDLSEIIFTEIQDLKEIPVYNHMISAYVQSRKHEKAIILLQEMMRMGIKHDEYTISGILSIMENLTFGRQVHGYAVKLSLDSKAYVGCSVLKMYSECGNLEEFVKAFEQLERKDYVSYTSMISSFAENGCPDKAIKLFQKMWLKEESILDEAPLVAVLNACSSHPSLKLGREVHGFALRLGFDNGAFIGSALVNMYSKCGDLDSAKIVFLLVSFKDEVLWSSLISGYSQRGHIEEALRLFHHYRLSDVSVDVFTISSLVANSSNSNIGSQLQSFTIKTGLESDSAIGSSLVMMYSKWGNIEDCAKVFRQTINPDVVSWSIMFTSYAHHGKGLEALRFFEHMKKSKIKPDSITFVGVLTACSHAGLVEEGYFHLNSMIREYGIKPGPKHYACMVDLLGRAGRFEEAERFIANMPIKPDILVWETLLACCNAHSNRELGKVAAEKMIELQPSDAGYVLISNMHAEAGEWEEVAKIRGSMDGSGVRKDPGWSCVGS